MRWRFEPGEELHDAFARVAGEEIARLRGGLGAAEEDYEARIHEARQGFKRLRALLRLAKPALGSNHAEEDRRWRDAGRMLSASRDATVLRRTFDKLVADHGGKLPAKGVAGLQASLADEGPGPSRADTERSIDQVLGTLDAAEDRLHRLSWPKGAEEFFRGLKKGQARLEKSWNLARADMTADSLHRLRKRLKDQSAQLRLVRRIVPKACRALRARAKETAELLGEEHDLGLLFDRLNAVSPPAGSARARGLILKDIEKRRQELRREAFRVLGDLSSPKPKVVAGEIADAWADASTHKSQKRKRSA